MYTRHSFVKLRIVGVLSHIAVNNLIKQLTYAFSNIGAQQISLESSLPASTISYVTHTSLKYM